MSDLMYSDQIGGSSASASTDVATSIDSVRRLYSFGDRIYTLAPEETPFFAFLGKFAKMPVDESEFKVLTERKQWHRRYGKVASASVQGIATAATSGSADPNGGYIIMTLNTEIQTDGQVDSSSETHCPFLLVGQVLKFFGTDVITDATVGAMSNFVARVEAVTHTAGTSTLVCLKPISATISGSRVTGTSLTATATSWSAVDNTNWEVIGTAYAEGTTSPDGWADILGSDYAYTQIFKTSVEMSGTAMATRFRGIPDEWKRKWANGMKEHKVDIERALLFGNRYKVATDGQPTRYTEGIISHIQTNSPNVFTGAYKSYKYDTFIDNLEQFFDPAIGVKQQKLVLAGMGVLTWLNKIGGGGFLGNSTSNITSAFDIKDTKSAFGHDVKQIVTSYGTLNLIHEPLFRRNGAMHNTMIAIDLRYIKYRPLVGNGVNRDTFIKVGVQTPDQDIRKDMILTEAGLESTMPEAHAMWQFS